VKKTVLCFVFDQTNRKLLMIFKKTGQGQGKWNVPGGKVEASESVLDAVVRETKEETGIEPIQPTQVGQLEFCFEGGNSWDNSCSVFATEQFDGTLILETEECSAHWVAIDKIPYEQMWESDKQWVPLIFEKNFFHRSYTFDSEDRVVSTKIIT
jgi:8-oxo-dGTP diphosphatase